VGVGISEVLAVTKFCGLSSGVTVVDASALGEARLACASETATGSGVLWTVVVVVGGGTTAAVSGVSTDAAKEDSIDVGGAVSDTAATGTVVVIVVDMRRVTVSPAGMEGLVAGPGTVVDCS
jgi:hypothetical protein